MECEISLGVTASFTYVNLVGEDIVILSGRERERIVLILKYSRRIIIKELEGVKPAIDLQVRIGNLSCHNLVKS